MCLVCNWECESDDVLALHLEEFHPETSRVDCESLVDGSLDSPARDPAGSMSLFDNTYENDPDPDAGSDDGFGAEILDR
jgi:hypothetical protein